MRPKSKSWDLSPLYIYVRIYTCVCLWLIHVMYGRNQHNIVKQLSTSKKIKDKKIKSWDLVLKIMGRGDGLSFFLTVMQVTKGG